MQYYPQQPYPNGQPLQQYPQQVPVQQVQAQPYQQTPVQQVPAQPYQQTPVQQVPAQPYPQQYPMPAYPQQVPTPPFVCPMTQEQYEEHRYKRSLRRTVNSIGTLLLIFFGLEIIVSIVATIILYSTGNISDISESDPLFLVENGMISMIIFFVAGLIYCLIRKLRFAVIFPFEKVGGALLAKLCVIGLSFSLMSNYVVDLINNTFGLFGIENGGGNIDAGSEPNILIYFLTVAILPALAEEFAFRGVIMGSLRPYSEGLAILVSSATFALMHGNFVQLPFTFCCGIVFAYLDMKTNSLLPSIIVHFLNNGLAVLFDIVISYELMSEFAANACYGVFFLITGILSLVFIKGMAKNNDSLFSLKGGNDIIPFKKKVQLTVTSPTMIIYTAVMILYCIFYLTTL